MAKLALGRTSNPRMLPQREDHAGSRRSWAGAERSLVDGGGTRVHVVDIGGARRRSHEPTAGPELGLGWPESTHRWTGTPGRAASLDCSGRSEGSDAGRARLDRVEGGDSRQTGPSRTTIQYVPLGANGTLIPSTGVIGDNGILRRQRYYFRSRLRPFLGESVIVIETPVPRNGSHEYRQTTSFIELNRGRNSALWKWRFPPWWSLSVPRTHGTTQCD